MAKYRVWAECIDYVYIDVEAENGDQAYEFARDYVDGGEYHTSCHGDWEMDNVVQLDDSSYVDYSYDDVIDIMEGN